MLKSYEATLDHGRLEWIAEQPEVVRARIIVTILEENGPVIRRRKPPASIAGKGKTLGDIIKPIIDEEDWECLK